MIMLKSTHRRLMAELQAKHKGEILGLVDSADDRAAIMADQIRFMDQLIFQMSQCSDWLSMQPLFNKLQAVQEARQREESNRMSEILKKEMVKTYYNPKRIGGRS